MRIDYMHLPELADKRHVIVDGRRTVNTAAKPSNIIYLFDHGRVPVPEEEENEPIKQKSPRRGGEKTIW